MKLVRTILWLLPVLLAVLAGSESAIAGDRVSAPGADRLGGCTYTLSPASANVFSSGGNVNFTVTTQPGCAWTATTTANWIQITSGNGTGNGSVALSVNGNSFIGPPRSASVMVAGQPFTVSQAGSCQWRFDPFPLNVGPRPGRYTISVGLIPYCDFRPFLSTTGSWITNLTADVPNQTVTFDVSGNSGGIRSESIVIGAATRAVVQASSAASDTPFDFDGDARTDIAIYRPAAGEWWHYRSSDQGNRAFQFGAAADLLAPADYTGDGKADAAFYRNGDWYILRSEDFSFYSFPFGNASDVPSPADFDGDNKHDPALFRPATGEWFIQRSTGGVLTSVFGLPSDRPVAADYDGDGKADLAIFRPLGSSGMGEWWYQRSIDGGDRAFAFGEAADKAVPGDYTGDGKADLAFFRPSTGNWFILRSSDLSFYSFPFGNSTDIPAPGDYDGDGRYDAAVFRPSNTNWYVQRSTAGILIQQFGASTDRPVPGTYVR
jgi:hypothetical protein